MWSIGGCGNSGSLIGSQLPVKKVWPSYSFHFASQAFSDVSTISGQDQSGTISFSVNGNSGVVGVNQSTGNMNNQASLVSMAVLTSSVAITLPTP